MLSKARLTGCFLCIDVRTAKSLTSLFFCKTIALMVLVGNSVQILLSGLGSYFAVVLCDFA